MTSIATPPRKPLPPALRPWRLYLVILGVVVLVLGAVVLLGGRDDSTNGPTDPAGGEGGSPSADQTLDALVGASTGSVEVEVWNSQSRYGDVREDGLLLFKAAGGFAEDGSLVLDINPEEGVVGDSGAVPEGSVYILAIQPDGNLVSASGPEGEGGADALAATWIPGDGDARDPADGINALQGLTLGGLSGLTQISGSPQPSGRWPGSLEYVVPTGEFSPPAPGLLRWSRDRVSNAEAWVYTKSEEGVTEAVLDVVVLDPEEIGPVSRYVVVVRVTESAESTPLPPALARAIAEGYTEIPSPAE